jgi:hypothetical protein
LKIIIIFLTLLSLLTSSEVKIASYNVENLFDDVYNGSEYDKYIPSRYNYNSHIYNIKLQHTAEVICDIDADIIALQEIENQNVLKNLLSTLKKAGCAYRYSAITTKRNAPIQIALLSRKLIRYKKELIVSPSPKIRNILEVVVDIDGYPLHIFVNHWKSIGYRGFESKRFKYAKTLKARLDILPKNSEYIILGDFNTNYDAKVNFNKKIDDTNGKVALLDVLPLIKDSRLADEKLVQNSNRYLYDLWLELPYSLRYSHKFFANKSTLDHIIIPHSMFDKKAIDYKNDSFKVFRKAYLFNKYGINHWQIKNGKHIGKGYSDHLPIYAIFTTSGYKSSAIDNNKKASYSSIKKLYTIDKITNPLIIKNAVVVLKRGNYAIIQQPNSKRGIFVYGAKGLKEKRAYDLQINEIGIYKGLKEIKSFDILQRYAKVDLKEFYAKDFRYINSVIKDVTGTYRNGYLYTNGIKIKIYFKNRKLKLKNGESIKIYYGHIGYYNGKQIVIYSKKDFQVE